MDATIQVYTFKEGLLSKLAHDLRLSAMRFDVSVRGNQVQARVDLGSLRVDGVVRSGRVEKAEPSPGDRQKILENLANEVLRSREYPEARFVGQIKGIAAPFRLEGQLTLHGETHPFDMVLNVRERRLVGETDLVPSAWRIKPFRALGGALRVQDRVRIAIDASADWLEQGTELNSAIELVWTPRASRTSLRPA
jgi:hypothetical protein